MPTYEDPRFSGLFELLPHRKRNGKEGYMVARGKHKSPASKGGRNSSVVTRKANYTTIAPVTFEVIEHKPTPPPNLTRKQMLMGEIADRYRW